MTHERRHSTTLYSVERDASNRPHTCARSLSLMHVARGARATTMALTAACLASPLASRRASADDASHSRVAKPPGDVAALERVQLMFRHGDRTPITATAEDCDGANATWSSLTLDAERSRALARRGDVRESWRDKLYHRGLAWEGQLTTRGAAQMHALGREIIREWLIERCGFLSGDFARVVRDGEVKVRSTAVKRCVQSAQSALAGGWDDESDDASAQLEIEVREKERESMFPKPGSACERLSVLFKEAYEPAEHASREAFANAPHLARIRDGMEAQRNTRAGLTMVWDPLQCRVNHGMALPEGVRESDVAELLTMMERRHFTFFSDADAASLVGGRLLREICEEMVSPEKVKLCIYSGHDSSLIALFAALGVLGEGVREWPKTASSLIFETWRMRDGTRSVRAVYNGQPLMLTSTSRASDGLTPYDDFKAFVDSRVPSDFAAACRVPSKL